MSDLLKYYDEDRDYSDGMCRTCFNEPYRINMCEDCYFKLLNGLQDEIKKLLENNNIDRANENSEAMVNVLDDLLEDL